MSACERAAHWRRSLELFAALRARPEAPLGAGCCNAAISACAAGRLWQHGLQLIGEMPRLQVQPDIISYNAALSSCERGGKWEHALHLFGTMASATIRPDTRTHSTVLGALAKGGDWPRCLALIESMRVLGLPLDTYGASALLSAYRRGGAWERGLHVFDDLRAAADRPAFDAVAYDVGLALCDAGGRWENGLRLLIDMQRADCAPTAASYCALLRACERGGAVEGDGRVTATLEKELLGELQRCALELALDGEGAMTPSRGVHLVLAVDELHRRAQLGGEVEDAVREHVLVPAMASLLGNTGGSSSLVAHQGMGAYFTVELLAALGLTDGVASWQTTAQAAVQTAISVALRAESDKSGVSAHVPEEPAARRLVAWMSHAVLLKSGGRREDGCEAGVVSSGNGGGNGGDGGGSRNHSLLLRSAGRVVAHGRHAWSDIGGAGALLFPPGLGVPAGARGGAERHAERRALLRVAERLLNAAAEFSEPIEFTGTVRIYASHTPCLACLAVFCQFRARFPGIRLSIAFATWRETRVRLLAASAE